MERNHKKPDRKTGRLGVGWELNNRLAARLVPSGKGYTLHFAMGGITKFTKDPTDGICYANDRKERLVIEEDRFLIYRSDQSVWAFERQQGTDGSVRLARIDAPDGRGVLFDYDEWTRPLRIQAFHSVQERRLYGSISIGYDATDNLSEIIVKMADADGTLQNHARIRYERYGKNETHGNFGDLKTVTRLVGKGKSWEEGGTVYYRYYLTNDSRGHCHALKSVLHQENFDLAREKFGEKLYESTDEELAAFMSRYFEYDRARRTVLEKTLRGTTTKRFEYESFSGSNDSNIIRSKTTENRSDGETRVVYKNGQGKAILRETTVDLQGEKDVQREYRVFDRGGSTVKFYSPAAIRGHRIIDTPNGKKVEIDAFADQGEIISYELFSDRPKAKRKLVTIQNGEAGTPITLRRWSYAGLNSNGKKTSRLDKITEYPSESEDNVIETAYQYELFPNSTKTKRKTTLLPVVSEEEHGDGTQASYTDIFDSRGRTVWSVDEAGVISHSVYNERTGKLVRRIDDVDTTKTGDFGTPLPEGWKTPEEAGKHDVTDYFYDFKGRLIQTINPESEGIDDIGKLVRCRPVSWTVYDDAARAVRSASGYLELDEEGKIVKTVLVNPVSITIHDADGNITDQIQASRKSLEGPFTEKDRFEQDSYISWTKSVYRFGKRIAMRQYHVIPECSEGMPDDCYAETTFDYDLQGRQVRTVSPSGAIHRTVYDTHGNAVQSWIGTNDVGATDENPKSNDPANDMRLVNETVYGRGEGNCASCGGGGGDRVLAQVQYLEEGKSRVTEYKYDWRGRQVETLGDEDENGNSIASVQYYDNLDRVIKTEQYLHEEDKKTKRHEQRLLSRTQMFLNARGQAWKTVQSIIEKKSKQS